jgi:predicted dehydrogenase
MTNISIIGSSRIIEEHIKACKKLKMSVKAIFSPNKNSINLNKLSKKYMIKKFYHFKDFIEFSKIHNCSFILAPRIKDNEYYLRRCLKLNKKILIEKPVFVQYEKFRKYFTYNDKIFVAYNRVFYKGVKDFKKFLSKKINNEILCICPEKNKKSIILNSCHIISILIYFFEDLKLIYKRTTNKQIYCIFSAKKNFISLIFNFKSKDLFKIENFDKNKKFILSPIERLQIFNSLTKKISKNNNIYSLKKLLDINEFDNSNIKPGFYKQMKYFKQFIENKIDNEYDLKFASKISKVCNNIIK